MKKVNFRQGMTIKEIGEQMQSYVTAHWKKTLDDHQEAFLKLFPEMEDATYGLYLDKLLPPIFESLEQSGFITIQDPRKGDFFIGKETAAQGCFGVSSAISSKSRSAHCFLISSTPMPDLTYLLPRRFTRWKKRRETGLLPQ